MATDSKGNTALIWAAYQGQDKLQKMDRQIQFRKFLGIEVVKQLNQSYLFRKPAIQSLYEKAICKNGFNKISKQIGAKLKYFVTFY